MTTDLRLPRREEGIKVLRSMEPEDLERFVGRLLEAMWDAHRARELPESLTVLLRDWLAHAHFEASPAVRERIRLIEEGLRKAADDVGGAD